jgi:hypothetical protein
MKRGTGNRRLSIPHKLGARDECEPVVSREHDGNSVISLEDTVLNRRSDRVFEEYRGHPLQRCE